LVEPSWSLNVTHGEITSTKREAVVRDPRLEDGHELLLVAGEAARDERRAQGEREQHRVDRLLRFASPRFAFDPTSADAENCPFVRP
jgi:hypothetical protein